MNLVRTAPQTEHGNLPSRSSVWAVVVTYNPTPDFEANVRAVVPQVKKLIIVDNQSSAASRQLVEKVARTYEAESIWSEQNLGIASALNVGVRIALSSNDCRWVLMLDQDSQVSRDFVATCLNAYEACPFKETVALIGANYQLPLRNPPQAPCGDQRTPRFREIVSLMTSGTLAKAEVFSTCGGFDESFFMDYVDHEFCFRVRRRGFRIIQVSDAILQHRLGAPTSHQLFGISFITSNYSPSRRYHNARNRIICYRRYFVTETTWILSDWIRWLRETVKMILVEPDRRRKLASVIRGGWEGFKTAKWPAGMSSPFAGEARRTSR